MCHYLLAPWRKIAMQKYYLLALMLSMGLIISRPAQADQKADKLLEDVKSVLKNAQSFSAQATINTVSGKNSNKQVMIIKMQKPDKAVEITTGKYSSGESLDDSLYADGKNLWVYDKAVNEYIKQPLIAGLLMLTMTEDISLLFFNSEALSADAPGVSSFTTNYLGTKKVEGVTCQVIEVAITQSLSSKRVYYIGPDKMLRRVTYTSKTPDGLTLSSDTLIAQIKLNPTLSAADFAFTPPPGAKQTSGQFSK